VADWSLEKVGDQTGRVAVITGGNSGLGYEAATVLAQAGAHVVMACRSAQRAAAAIDSIRDTVGNEALSLEVMPLDLADLASVHAFADIFLQRFERLDLLINNAGVMAIPRSETVDGFETQFGVNHLAHFALTGLLLARLRATPGSRVVSVSSLAATRGRIHFDDIHSKQRYNRAAAYCQSKLANALFARELQRRLDPLKESVISVAAHPGFCATNLMSAPTQSMGVLGVPLERFLLLFCQSQAAGAQCLLRAALDVALEGGEYIGPHSVTQLFGRPISLKFPKSAQDSAAAQRLWDVSCEQTGVSYLN